MKNKLLLLLILPSLVGCTISADYSYQDADKYTEYSESFEVENKISTLNVNWIGGSVKVLQGEKFIIEEEKTDNPLYYWNQFDDSESGGVFTIQCLKSGTDTNKIDFSKKNLTITVPYELDYLNLDIVSGNYEIDLDSVKELDINVVSGNGQIELGSNKRTTIDTVSGTVTMEIRNTSIEEKIVINSVSGNITFLLDPQRGFDVNFDSISGTLRNNFGTPENPSLSKYLIEADTVSSNVAINKLA